MTKIDTSTETVTKISDDLMMTARVGTDNVRHAQLMDDASNVINALQARVEDAEVKLTKAVAALREMMEDAEYPDAVWEKGAAVLEELDKK
jgi:uncharacterized protein (UPF0147 family)